MAVPVDSAVSSLIDSITTAEKKRRLVAMRRNEIDSKLSLATQDNQLLQKRKLDAAAHESDVKAQLEKLTEEYRQLQLMLMAECDRVRHCELEEPMLEKHLKERMDEVTASTNEWKERGSTLEALAALISGDTAVGELKANLRQLQGTYKDLIATKGCLEREIEECNREIQKMSCADDEQLSLLTDPLNDSDVLVNDENEDEQNRNLKECHQRMEYEWSQTLSHGSHQLLTLQREVDDLDRRREELAKWFNDVDASRARFTYLHSILPKCLTASLCSRCYSKMK